MSSSSTIQYAFQESNLILKVNPSGKVRLFTFLKSLTQGQAAEATIYRWIADYSRTNGSLLDSNGFVSFLDIPKIILYFGIEKSWPITQWCQQYINLNSETFDIDEDNHIIKKIANTIQLISKAKNVIIIPSAHEWDYIRLPYPTGNHGQGLSLVPYHLIDTQVRTIKINNGPVVIDALASIQAVYDNGRDASYEILKELSGELNIHYFRIEG